jgi:hypothetical protein
MRKTNDIISKFLDWQYKALAQVENATNIRPKIPKFWWRAWYDSRYSSYEVARIIINGLP